MKTEEQILNLWHPKLHEAVLEVFGMYKDDPKIILTESDLKCWLYSRLIGKNVTEEGDECKYSVHSEVTHYHPDQNEDGVIKKDYHFRDLSLLQEIRIAENEDRVDSRQRLNKGFNHIGAALHVELKLARQGITKNRTVAVSTSDIENFGTYGGGGLHEKTFVMVWGSRAADYTAQQMKETFDVSIKKVSWDISRLITPYIFDRTTLLAGLWNDWSYDFSDITNDAVAHCKEVFNTNKQ